MALMALHTYSPLYKKKLSDTFNCWSAGGGHRSTSPLEAQPEKNKSSDDDDQDQKRKDEGCYS